MTVEPEFGKDQVVDRPHRQDRLSSLTWALIFIWAGGVLLAQNLGYLQGWQTRFSDLPGWWRQFGLGAWPLILLGAGVVVLVEVALRLLVPAWRRSVTGSIILGIVLIGAGLGDLTNWGLIWPAILIVLGASMLLRGFFRRG